MRDTRYRSGTGAAHIGFSMFGARGPLLNEHDAGGSAGGGSNGTTQQTTEQQAGTANQQTVVFSPEQQAHIDAAIKKAQDAAFANARRTFEGKAKNGQQPKPETKSETTADDPSSLLTLRDSFDDATTEMKLTKGQRQLLREAVMTKRPGDVEGFISDFATRAGWTTEPSTTTPPADANHMSQQPKQPAAARPLSENGSVAGSPAERAADVTKWTTEDVERFYQSKNGIVRRGDDGTLDVNDPRNSKIHRELRGMARARLANVRIRLGARRQ
jgi:hypothetical protein